MPPKATPTPAPTPADSPRIPLRDVGRRFRFRHDRGHRWATRGLKGQVLATIRENGRVYTTEAALAAFCQATGYVQVAK